MKKTDALIILDGYGFNENEEGNAIAMASTPNLDRLFSEYPSMLIQTSGLDVGLPSGQMGNSEVGHLNIGAGRIVYQDITRIDKSIQEGDFFSNPAFCGAIENCKEFDSALHLVGLLSDGGVHSSINHLYALLKLASDNGLKKVYIHCVTDGRDTPPKSADSFVEQLENELARVGCGKIASIVGRFYYMDRDKRWERVERGYACVFDGYGECYSTARDAVVNQYSRDVFDEFFEPCVIGDYKGVAENDSIIFFNFRADRAREITEAAISPIFNVFQREGGYKKTYYVCMTQYDERFSEVHVAFQPKSIDNTLGEYLSKCGKTQTRIAETEKYAHVTFFFNGGEEAPNEGEERILVPSPKVTTYDTKPEMSASEVTDAALGVIGSTDVLIMNYANCDMVGHTGIIRAATLAVEAVDQSIKSVVDAVLATGGSLIITADHGNAEQMKAIDGSPMTAHTTNPVPLIIVSEKYKSAKLIDNGGLCDIAPTLLFLMGLTAPPQMEGKNLIASIK